jgi:hypothetical protein
VTRVKDNPTETRYPNLYYQMIMPGCWKIIDSTTGQSVGPSYLTKDELLADLDRFAKVYGC